MRSIRLWNSLLLKVVRAEWFELHHSNSSHGITFTLSTESVSIKKNCCYICVSSTLHLKKQNTIFTFSLFLHFLLLFSYYWEHLYCFLYVYLFCFVFMQVADRRIGKCRVFIMWSVRWFFSSFRE